MPPVGQCDKYDQETLTKQEPIPPFIRQDKVVAPKHQSFGAGKHMDSKKFIDIRKKLDKTQKDLASLLGISLKAVCSYEQGWRPIPVHVERQLIFLLAKKIGPRKDTANCWEIRNCPEEKKKQCPAWEFNSGDFCWFISGTICNNTTHTTWDKKIEVCNKCVVMKKLQ
jgi:DNA-binding XRE family transcriptional regulator